MHWTSRAPNPGWERALYGWARLACAGPTSTGSPRAASVTPCQPAPRPRPRVRGDGGGRPPRRPAGGRGPGHPRYTCDRCREGNTNLCPQVRFAGHGTTDGGLSEFLAWPTALLHPVPGDFDDGWWPCSSRWAWPFTASTSGHVHLASSVAVVGCGPIGLMLVQASRVAGAARVVAVEPLYHRRDAAARSGA